MASSLENQDVHDNGVEQSSLQPEKPFHVSDAELLASPITLPCGRVVANRLVKVSMYEHLATFFGGPPNTYHISLYSQWAHGGWGMIITGNVQICPFHLTLGRDITIPLGSVGTQLNSFKALSAAMRSSTIPSYTASKDEHHSPLAIMQLNHSARQSPRFLGGRFGTFRQPVGPSRKRVGDDSKDGSWLSKATYWFFFQTPRSLKTEEVKLIIGDFVNATRIAYETGFDGVQLHAAHGYLLSQFLSPKLNNRQDEYSDRLLLLQQIILRIRAELPSQFILGIKLNVADYVFDGLSEEDALNDIQHISQLGVDFIEISGGSYENPVFTSTSRRQAFFTSFSRKAMESIPTYETKGPIKPLIILTGGLRTPSQMARAISQKHANLLGIGRLSVLCPDFPGRISPTSVARGDEGTVFPIPEPVLHHPPWLPKWVGASVGTTWYVVGMRQIARGKNINPHLGSYGTIFGTWVWIEPSSLRDAAVWISIGFVFVLVLVSLSG